MMKISMQRNQNKNEKGQINSKSLKLIDFDRFLIDQNFMIPKNLRMLIKLLRLKYL